MKKIKVFKSEEKLNLHLENKRKEHKQCLGIRSDIMEES